MLDDFEDKALLLNDEYGEYCLALIECYRAARSCNMDFGSALLREIEIHAANLNTSYEVIEIEECEIVKHRYLEFKQ